MLLPFLSVNSYIDDPDGGGGLDADDAEALLAQKALDDADAEAAQKALDDAELAKGKTGITDSEAKLLKDVMAKKKALKDANDNLAKITDQLKAFDGIDPAEVRKLLQDKKDAENTKLEASGQWDKLKQQMAEAHVVEMTGAKTQLTTLEGVVAEQANTISELTVGSAFSNSPFIKTELLMTPSKTRAAYGTHFSYENGVIVGYDKPSGSKDRSVLVDSAGEPLSFEDALKKIVDVDPDRDEILRSKLKAGSKGATVPAKKAVNTTEEKLSGRSKIENALTGFLNPQK